MEDHHNPANLINVGKMNDGNIELFYLFSYFAFILHCICVYFSLELNLG